MEWDEAQHFPVDVFKRAGGLGMLGVTIPEEYGGAGLSYVDYVNVIEELGVVDSGFALSVAAHNSLCTGHIYLAGNDEQKKKWLPKLTSGEWIGAWGLDRARLRQRRLRHAHHRRARTATTGCSTARRTSSPTPPTPTSPSFSP